MWDTKTNGPKAITRDDVGETMSKKDVDPALEARYQIKLADGKTVYCATLWTLYR